jgi:hypothetical protein
MEASTVTADLFISVEGWARGEHSPGYMIFPLLVGPSGREWAFEGVGESELALADVRVLDGRILLAEYAPTGRPIPS